MRLFVIFLLVTAVFLIAGEVDKENGVMGGSIVSGANESEDWSGTFACVSEGMKIEGEWELTVTGNNVEGTVTATHPPILTGDVTGVISDGMLEAKVAYKLLGEEKKGTWKGEIKGADVMEGTTDLMFDGSSAECVWNGTKKPAIFIQYGTIKREINGSRINLTYIPICYENCTKIVFIQVISEKAVFADGTFSYYTPSDSDAAWSYQDGDCVDGGKSSHVDFVAGERDPYYNGDDRPGRDSGKQGKHGSSLNATMADRPKVGDGEFDALSAKFGKNVAKVVYEFEDCMFCAEGKDAGKYYGCMTWTYEQEKGKDGSASQPGTTSSGPSDTFGRALQRWDGNHGFRLPGG